jgi:hypothetical protein
MKSRSSETFLNAYQTTRRHVPEDSSVQENLRCRALLIPQSHSRCLSITVKACSWNPTECSRILHIPFMESEGSYRVLKSCLPWSRWINCRICIGVSYWTGTEIPFHYGTPAHINVRNTGQGSIRGLNLAAVKLNDRSSDWTVVIAKAKAWTDRGLIYIVYTYIIDATIYNTCQTVNNTHRVSTETCTLDKGRTMYKANV